VEVVGSGLLEVESEDINLWAGTTLLTAGNLGGLEIAFEVTTEGLRA